MDIRLGMVEARFADVIWANAPMTTRELVDLCAKELNWKRTTTYTVLKKLTQRGIFAVDKSIVTVLITKDEFHAIQSEAFVDKNFQGSLPAFIAAFTTRKTPSQEELAELKKLIDSFGA